jgi:hypothetical protein
MLELAATIAAFYSILAICILVRIPSCGMSKTTLTTVAFYSILT